MKRSAFERFQSSRLSDIELKSISGGDVASCIAACAAAPCTGGKTPTVHCCYFYCTGQPLTQDCLSRQPYPWCGFTG